MTTSPSPNSSQPKGETYRFVVKSASEAVRTIREKLGERAVVTSIKQLKGQGLLRAFSAPQLEVIATVPPKLSEAQDNLSTEAAEVPFVVPPPISVRYESSSEQGEVASESSVQAGSGKSLYEFLNKSGFDSSLLTDLQQFPEWTTWERLPLGRVL